jgi:hypothetical protein
LDRTVAGEISAALIGQRAASNQTYRFNFFTSKYENPIIGIYNLFPVFNVTVFNTVFEIGPFYYALIVASCAAEKASPCFAQGDAATRFSSPQRTDFILGGIYMSEKKTLVVYFSQKGHAKKVAEELQRLAGADIEQLEELNIKAGPVGFVVNCLHGVTKKRARLAPLKYDAADYERLYVVSPVWAGGITPAAREYLYANAAKIKELRLVTVAASSDCEGAKKEAADEIKISVAASAAIFNKEISDSSFVKKLEALI